MNILETMTGHSSSEDIRNLTNSAMDSSTDHSRRFTNVDKHILAVSRAVNNM